MADEALVWIDSAGGPLIVLPAEIAHHWRGIEPPPGATIPDGWSWGDPDGPICDYDRACAVDDYLGVVQVDPGFGLVLGDEPLRTTFLPTPDGGIFARWYYSEEGNDTQRSVASTPSSLWEITSHQLRVGRGGLILLDSALQGGHPPRGWCPHDPSNWLRIRLEEGEYGVELADSGPNERYHLILFKLSRLRG